MNAKDDFTDSIDDIIHLLNTTNGLANKLKPN